MSRTYDDIPDIRKDKRPPCGLVMCLRHARLSVGFQNTFCCFFFTYTAPGRGTGYCFRVALCFFVSLFVSLSATLRENGWTDLHEIFREGVE